MASVVVTMSGDDAKLWKAFENVIKQQERSKKGYDGLGKASEDAAKKSREYARGQAKAEKEKLALLERGKRLTQSLLTPQEKYNQSLAEAKELMKKGAISQDTLLRRQKQLKNELQKSTEENRKQSTLLDGAVSKIGAYATAAGAVGAAIGAIRAAWQQVIKEQEKGLEALKKNEDTGRALLQISDSQEQFQALRQQSQQLSSEFGVDISTVERVMFSAVSEGFRDAVPEIIAANQVIAPEAAAGVAGQIPSLFKGQVGGLEAVNLTLRAARDSRLNFEQIARSLPSAAEGGAVAGASIEETVATLSVLASRFKSGDTAADRIKAFTTKTGIDDRFAGQGIVGAFESIQALPEDERKKFLGESQELNTAFKVLGEELDTIKQRVAEIKQERQAFAQGGGVLRDRMAIAGSDAQLSALRQNNIATENLERAYREGRGIEGAAADAAVKGAEQTLLQSGSFVGRTFGSSTGVSGIVARGSVALGADAETAGTTGAATANQVAGPLGQFATFLGAMNTASRAMANSAQKQEAASDKMLKAAEEQNRQRPADQTNAARAQAALAGQGS